MEINKEISMSTNNGTRDHKLEIELLKRDVTSIREFNQKLDDTVDKIEEAARDIKTNLTQHEYKILHQEHINKDMEEQLEKHIKESEERARELNTKIECVDDKIEKVNSELTEKIQQSQVTIIEHMLRGRVELRQDINKINDNFGKKIGELDAWRYMVMGAIAFIVFIVGNISGITTAITKLFR